MQRLFWTCLASILVCGLIGCQEKKEEVAVGPDQDAVFPENHVPPAEPQPVGSPVSGAVGSPVDTDALNGPTTTPQPKEHYGTSSGTRTHVVQKGETLSSIARQHYNGDQSKWRQVAEANRSVLNGKPDQLTVGMKLVIP